MMSNFVAERLNCDISDMRLVESVYYPKNPVDLLFLSVSLPRLNAPRWVSLRRGLMRASASHKARISGFLQHCLEIALSSPFPLILENSHSAHEKEREAAGPSSLC
jgi:hypothetical protein